MLSARKPHDGCDALDSGDTTHEISNSSDKVQQVVNPKSVAGKTYKEFRKKETVSLPFGIILNELRYYLRIDYSLAPN